MQNIICQMNAKIILENINKIMKPIICIISFFALGLIPSYAENKSDSLISEMREVELFIEKPTDKLPMMLSIRSASQQKNLEINTDSFLTGFFTFLYIDYKDGRSRMKAFGNGYCRAFSRSGFQVHSLDSKIPLDFLTASVFNGIYQSVSDLNLENAKSVSIQIYFDDITKAARDSKTRYATNKLAFPKDELFDIIKKYPDEPNVMDFSRARLNTKTTEK